MTPDRDFLQLLHSDCAMLVHVHSHRGSVPRVTDAWMAVFAQSCVGSIGGGHLEWQAIAHARWLLQSAPKAPSLQRYALGPTLGQCCGGEVVLRFERVTAEDVPRLQLGFAQRQAAWPRVALFGGGHVARALVRVLGPLPVQVHWLDSRDEIFPPDLPENVYAEQADPVHSAVVSLAALSHVLIMSFSHAEDLDVLRACLQRRRQQADLPFIGLIGSQTKRARFFHRLQACGFTPEELAQVTCPIGLPGITNKAPEVIAVAVAAQLLQVMEHGVSATHLTKET